MKNTTTHRCLLALLLGAATLPVASCAGPAKKAAKDQDYIEVYDTGSNLPRRIPKTKKAADASTADDTQTVDPNALNAVNERNATAKAPAGLGK